MVNKQGVPMMPDVQKRFLLEKLESIKKITYARFFLAPVDPIALNLPTYLDIIKHPMDLNTIEEKLNGDRYITPQEFQDDIEWIVKNSVTFNDTQHVVTHAGNNMLAYARNATSKLPDPPASLPRTSKKRPLDSTEVPTAKVELDTPRALVLWSRWLYGQPMWNESNCTDVDEDLECLLDVYLLSMGLNGKGRDYKAMNASLDTIRQILVNDIHISTNPLRLLSGAFVEGQSLVYKMMVDLLVYEKCARDSRTEIWLQGFAVSGQPDENDIDEVRHCEVFKVLSLELAKKASGGSVRDPMAPCAYHDHPPGSECNAAS